MRFEVFQQHLESMWQQLRKPESLQTSKFSDYFQVEFVGLPDKRYCSEQFTNGSKLLLNRIMLLGVSKSIGLHSISSQVPANMYSMFVQQLWGQISSLQGFKLYNIMEAFADQACITAVDAAVVKFEKQKKWLKLKDTCQEPFYRCKLCVSQ